MYDRVFTLAMASGDATGVASVDLSPMPGGRRMYLLTAWQTAAWPTASSPGNIYLLRGVQSLTEAMQHIVRGGTDVLMVVPYGGTAEISLPDDVNSITAFYERANTSGQFQAVTFRVREIKSDWSA